jgi:hypothetical protein
MPLADFRNRVIVALALNSSNARLCRQACQLDGLVQTIASCLCTTASLITRVMQSSGLEHALLSFEMVARGHRVALPDAVKRGHRTVPPWQG